MISPVQVAMIRALACILRPIVKLVLLCGLGYVEFSEVAKLVFVNVTRETFGIRGRPTNTSRVAAITGLSRKQIARMRSAPPLAEACEVSPINKILRIWSHDLEFAECSGEPKVLPLTGEISFEVLVKKHVGDIPPGAVKTELERRGLALELNGKYLSLRSEYNLTSGLQEEDIHTMAEAWSKFGETLVSDAQIRATDRR